MKKVLIFLGILGLLLSCINSVEKRNEKHSTIVAIMGYEYYYIKLNVSGEGIAKRGRATDLDDALLQKNFIDSTSFNVNSAPQYFNKLKEFEKKPYRGAKMLDSYHVRIYSNDLNVYDSYRFDSKFWSLIKSVGEDIPAKYNPFMQNSPAGPSRNKFNG